MRLKERKTRSPEQLPKAALSQVQFATHSFAGLFISLTAVRYEINMRSKRVRPQAVVQRTVFEMVPAQTWML